MPYVVTDVCMGTKDLSCVAVCPVDCIYELDEMVVISPSECIDCGACEPECPVEAITTDTEIEPEKVYFIEVNAAWDNGGAVAASAALAEWKAGVIREKR